MTHHLINGDAAHPIDGCALCRPDLWDPVSMNSGHARCTCGAVSAHLSTANQRRTWGRDHPHKEDTP